MYKSSCKYKLFLLLLFLLFEYGYFGSIQCVNATITGSADPSDRFTYVEDGEFSQKVHIPTYEWIPKNQKERGIIFAVHGLTLHGKTFEITGRAFACNGFHVIAPDMRGYGRCYADPHNKFSDEHNNRHFVNYEKSTDDFLSLAKLLHQQYPDEPIILLAESLGCTMALRLASYESGLFHSMILSAPAMRLNPSMFISPDCVKEYSIGFLSHPLKGISMMAFFKHLVSNDEQVVQGALDDPLIRKKLHPYELVKTLGEIGRTSSYARKVSQGMPVLMIQGSDDKCVSPMAVSKLAHGIKSDDQTIRWFYAYGHLAFETSHLRASVLTALINWFKTHEPNFSPVLEEMEKQIVQLGGTLRD